MANHLSAPACIDFFGLPGSGKSVLSHQVAKELVIEGYDVDEVSFDLDHKSKSFLRTIKKVLAVPLLLLRYPKTLGAICGILRYNGISSYSGLFFRHLINLSYKIIAYRGKRPLILFDEGFCQAVLSLSYKNAKFKEDSYQQFLECLGGGRIMISVLIQTSPETALERIRKRNDGQSRVDLLSDNAALESLNQMTEACKSLPQSIVIENEEIEHGRDSVNILVHFVKQILETC